MQGERQRVPAAGEDRAAKGICKVAMDEDGADVKHTEGASSFFSLMWGSFCPCHQELRKATIRVYVAQPDD